MIEIKVQVPEVRVSEFYEMFGKWLAAATVAPRTSNGPRPWSDNDEDAELAQHVWDKLSAPARLLFSVLLDSAGGTFSGEELAKRARIDKGKYGVAGVLAWPGRHCAAVDRTLPLEVTAQPDGGSADYRMPAPAAAVFAKARGTA